MSKIFGQLLIWLADFVDRRLVGALGWRENDEALELDRLVVAPEMHRHGVGWGGVGSDRIHTADRGASVPVV